MQHLSQRTGSITRIQQLQRVVDIISAISWQENWGLNGR